MVCCPSLVRATNQSQLAKDISPIAGGVVGFVQAVGGERGLILKGKFEGRMWDSPAQRDPSAVPRDPLQQVCASLA